MANNEGESRFRAPLNMRLEGENSTPEEREPSIPPEEEFNILPPFEIIIVSPEGDNPFRQEDPYQTFTYRSAFSDKEEEPETQVLYPERSALAQRVLFVINQITEWVSAGLIGGAVLTYIVKMFVGNTLLTIAGLNAILPLLITAGLLMVAKESGLLALIVDLPKLMFPKKKKKTVAA